MNKTYEIDSGNFVHMDSNNILITYLKLKKIYILKQIYIIAIFQTTNFFVILIMIFIFQIMLMKIFQPKLRQIFIISQK